ncbi:Molybdopterin-guanine dinucleotide biosynthesis protein A [Blastococcus sp. DSM 46786]|uniref:molybdenum cofactor guanylyltransferase n=1 Tax=Blastococcus sp. DSM 46786 TaxID=1798227 RepID=UPI0008D2F87E|nr:molybdenum cofactor guanylyltransferase [Blastococcus sp. DSM 46786]SEK30463.1 Molybdopterin-guanine dinucleotide biosynthesis protein A [Blastococcus sp. DSM 46786]
MDPLTLYSAVVLAGGRAERLGGQAKPQLRVGGRTLLGTVLDAVADARRRVVVGPAQEVPAGVLLMRETPPGGGPVTALRAGLEHVDTATVVVLAADLPFLTADLVGALRRRLRRDGVLVVDDTGRDQFLLGAWRTAALRAAVADPAGPRALHRVVSGLDVDRWSPPVEPGRPAPWLDCDTPEELARARAVGGMPPG